eukprot:GHUV01013668.1.p1 GENE.GHUV01013668.1~~GHUV01013668.1.p1  ORF type:complete len:388 (+),score=81.72 GHUV01013668.1:1220-2383(+)
MSALNVTCMCLVPVGCLALVAASFCKGTASAVAAAKLTLRTCSIVDQLAIGCHKLCSSDLLYSLFHPMLSTTCSAQHGCLFTHLYLMAGCLCSTSCSAFLAVPYQCVGPPVNPITATMSLVTDASSDTYLPYCSCHLCSWQCKQLPTAKDYEHATAVLFLPFVLLAATTGNSGFINMECFAATSAFPSTCEYAYSLASVSIFFCFILSLMQCLTMDCCGMGRAVEAGFDAAACVWWIAGGITLGVRATEANALGIERMNERNAVVALCWISAFMFLALLVTNLVLIKRLGRAYKHAAQQMQQHMTAYPVGGVQMMPMGQNTGGYPQPGQFQQQQYGQPGGTGAYPPQPGMGAFNAPPPGSFPQQQQPPQWTAPPGYPTTPPTGHNAV